MRILSSISLKPPNAKCQAVPSKTRLTSHEIAMKNIHAVTQLKSVHPAIAVPEAQFPPTCTSPEMNRANQIIVMIISLTVSMVRIRREVQAFEKKPKK